MDGGTWIIADARVDAQKELIAKLNALGETVKVGVPDVELILRAYRAWGANCVEHLLGDFAFAIWDGPCQKLFCARDQLGVKPFAYAQIGQTVVFGNTLDCIRLHPAVSAKLNDQAIADFVLFGCNQDKSTTSFADIARMPPAHTIEFSGTAKRLRRYWTLPIEGPLYFHREEDYVEQFLELNRSATSERIRSDKVSVFMSGGLDSTCLAATALDFMRGSSVEDPVHAFTLVYDHLIPDSERHFASLAAQRLKVPIHFFSMDRRTEWSSPGSRWTPEPTQDLLDPGIRMESYQAISRHSRIFLYGEGPDNALRYEWRPYLSWLVRNKHWMRLAKDLGTHLLHHKRVPLLITVPRMLRDSLGSRFRQPSFPEWLNTGMVKSLGLRDRWTEFNCARVSSHPFRPWAHSSFLVPSWPVMFEEFEPSYTHSRIECRHPFMDIRLLRFLLRVPAVPWCRAKYLVRRAFRHQLPKAVLKRPKTPLQKHRDFERIGKHGPPKLINTSRLASYGGSQIWMSDGDTSLGGTVMRLRFCALGYWLHMLDGSVSIQRER
jgi:asparagine synthase (glutamine-hydrolysing)